MAARSKASSRRSNLRGSHVDEIPNVTTKPQLTSQLPSLRSKRQRIPSNSDQEQVAKKIKVEKAFQRPEPLRIPLRSRPPHSPSPLSPRSHVTNPVLNLRRKLPKLQPRTNHQTPPIEIQPDEDVKDTQLDRKTTARKGPFPVAPRSQQYEKRTLRSHDGGSRSKSELAQYFPNYEQMISLDPTEPELLTSKTIVTFIDDLQDVKTSHPLRNKKQAIAFDDSQSGSEGLRRFTSIPLHNAQRLDLATLAQAPRRSSKDPLSTETYIKAHRRPERQEKQLRNIERERAQHEKVQLDRLLEELKGPDWLKAMGISGVTESEKKLYEPKRIYFVREVNALIEKFKQWKEEEKRRKVERDQALLEQLEEESNEESAVEEAESSSEGEDEEEFDEPVTSDRNSKVQSSPSNSSDVDAQASRQLLQEASSANSNVRSTRQNPRPRQKPGPKPKLNRDLPDTTTNDQKKRGRPSSKSKLLVPLPPDQPTIKSFFDKAHIRQATLENFRRGRHQFAFGRPIPDFDEKEFELPEEILNEKSRRQNARKGRRTRRGTIGDET